MTARLAAAASSLLAATLVVACGGYYEIPVETPIRPKLDVSAFQRVLVAGFIAGGTEDVDANLETVRLLRSQLRNKSDLRVIDADVLPLLDVSSAAQQKTEPEPGTTGGAPGDVARQDPPADGERAPIKEEKDLEPHEHIFADVEYWKRIGEEFQSPLIVTGTVMFMPHQRSGYVQREEEVYDSFGRRRVVPVRTYQERKGFILKPKFVFIDGRTGTTLYSESFREEVLYNANQSTPALSSYFELMERLMPSFLSTLSSQKIRGTRILLK
jgi:hypothetical protein